MNKDILEIFLDQFSLEFSGESHHTASVVITVNWFYPRENIRVLSTLVPLQQVSQPYFKDYQNAKPDQASYIERILFKEQRLGNSYFTCDVHRVDDPGAFGKMVETLFRFIIKGSENPFLGTGFGILLDQFNIDEAHLVKIASGKVVFDSTQSEGQLSLPLFTDAPLASKPVVDDFGDDIGDGSPVIAAGTANGELRLGYRQLRQ